MIPAIITLVCIYVLTLLLARESDRRNDAKVWSRFAANLAEDERLANAIVDLRRRNIARKVQS